MAVRLGPGRGGSGERLGLALSGGGFRAAFFHLGVLARLAELGILPKVEVISTVSGGSVIGTAYYLKVKRLLEETDGDPSPGRYIQLVDELDGAMRELVGKGVRGRIFANIVKNAEMLLPVRPSRRRYSRTDRLGDLLDRYLYKELFWGSAGAVPKRRAGACLSRDRQVELRGLAIKPGGDPVTEPLRRFNRCRTAKVPELVINATSLNTGHLWRFEAIRMGEHVDDWPDEEPAPPEPDIDANRVLAPGYFCIAGVSSDGLPMVPEAQQDFPLGLAVAASAAVPGAFRALPISKMYSGVRVQLVDGGVADNQGIQALEDHHCTRMIVSDASAQMADKRRPRGSILSVLTRSPSILGDRVRDLQLARDPNVQIVHLRKGLRPAQVEAGGAWSERVWPPLGAPVQNWSIHPRALDALSRIRTDLDTFSRREIDALACCGYVSIDEELAGNSLLGNLAAPPPPQGKRSFTYIEDALNAGDEALVERLVLGRRKFFRFLGPQGRLLRVLKWAFAVAVLAALAFMVVQLRSEIELDGWAVLPVLLLLAVPTVGLAGALLAYRMIRGVGRCLR